MNSKEVLTDRFLLRQLALNDVSERYVRWLNDPETSRFIEFAKAAVHTLESVKHYVKDQTERKDVLFLGIFLRQSGLHLGNIKFGFIDPVKSTAEMGILLGESQWRGRGVAAEVLNALSKYLHDEMGIDKIILHVGSDNPSAIRAYEKANFTVQWVNQAENAIGMACQYSATHTPPSRLAIGTVQFGLPYGVANQDGQVSQEEAQKILRRARPSGINTLDTATGYGTSEQVLGAIGVEAWSVITKIPPVPEDCGDVVSWMRAVAMESQQKLGLSKLRGLLLHRPLDLLRPDGETIYQTLTSFKEEGLVEKIGFSVYSPRDLDALWDAFPPDLVQVPFNVFDRRMQTSGWLQKMHQAGTEIHARSVFLQGLLLMNSKARPEKFSRWDDLWQKWQSWLEQQGLSPVQGALAFVRFRPEIDRIVVGIDSSLQLNEILAAAQTPIRIAPDTLACEDEALVDPSQWNPV